MALVAIDVYSRVIVTGTAKVLWAGNGNRFCIRSVDYMTTYAFLEAVRFAAYSLFHCFIALVLEQAHMVAAHKIGIFNATIALAHGDYRKQTSIACILIFRRIGYNRQAGHADQHQR